MLIKEIALEQRPRERLKIKGIDSLSDAELLAIVLQNGTNGESVVDLSHRLISTFGLEKLNSLSLQELMKIKGVKLAKAAKLLAAFELSKRIKSGTIYNKTINNPEDIANYYTEKLKDVKKECFFAVYLNTKNKILGEKLISVGTLNKSLVDHREIFKEALKYSANAVILVHNHPSGDHNQSPEDKKITNKIRECGKIMEIELLDHIVIGRDSFASI